MPNITIPPSVKEALRPLMTRKIAYGAAISLAAGIGLGAWLQPPSFHYGSTGTTVVRPPAQTDPWSADVSSASTLPYNPPGSSPNAFQMAAVSPPAGQAPTVQPAVQTSTVAPSRQDDAEQGGWPAAGDQPKFPFRVAYDSRPRPAPAAGRDWAEQAEPDRTDDRAQDLPPPPRWERPPEPRWAPPPEQRPSMQDRRWDFRPDGSAVPLDDGGD